MAARKKKRSSSTEPLVSAQRKKEVLGIILIALAFLLSLALVTYHPTDGEIARRFSLRTVLEPGKGQAYNALGHLGAAIAWLLVPNFLGYTTLALTGLMGTWGYVVLRRNAPASLPLLSVLTVVGAFLVASLIGWFSRMLHTDLLLWAGDVGLGVSGWMHRVLGTTGALVLPGVLLLIVVLLAVDHDVQRSMDRLEASLRTAREKAKAGLQTAKARYDDYRSRRREEMARATEPPASDGFSDASSPTPDAPPPVAPSAAGGPARRLNDMYRSRAPAPESPAPEPPSPDSPPASADEQPAPRASSSSSSDLPLEVQEAVEEEKAEDIKQPSDDTSPEDTPYTPPSIDLLDAATRQDRTTDLDELEENKRILLDKLATYNVEIDSIKAVVGPTVTRYELSPAPGVKVSRIKNLEDDLAMAMAAPSIRVIAPIPGKKAVGVEIPNRNRELVRLRSVLGTAKFRDADMELPVPLGKTIEGEVFIRDLATMPHFLIAGATGSGKSVGLNALMMGLIYALPPRNLRFVVIDPKKIELQQYALLADHFLALPEDVEEPIVTDFDEALGVLKSCEKEMEERYDLLSKASVRSITAYNRKRKAGRLPADEDHRHLPYLVVVVDELADLMMTAGKEIEGPIARLAQMARAVGIHLVLATQRPSVDVITGIIKANFPSRIAYQVASRVDSRTILDQAGAEGLVGNGDLLYMHGSELKRLQGPFVSIEEVERITEAIAGQPAQPAYRLPSLEDESNAPTHLGVDETDELFEKAAHIIVRRQQGSVSLLQRKLSVGYTRAGRIVDQLEEAGIVGSFAGTQAREVMVEDEEALDALLAGENTEEEDEPS